ncbi:hypothetical protein ACFL2V_01585 [Pseudomonadota bacterium]
MAVLGTVGELIKLKTGHAALQRNEAECLYFHPSVDRNDGERVFGICRTGGRAQALARLLRPVVVLPAC